MGSFVTINDTLRINKEQGFPGELDIEIHMVEPYESGTYDNAEYSFSQKEQIRVYQQPPLRNFLVEEIDGKWVPWGTCIITKISHDYVNKVTSGVYKILNLYTPDQIRMAMEMIHPTAPAKGYFENDS